MPKPIRRVVTGHNAAGRSVFVMDAGAARLPAQSGQRGGDRIVGDAEDARRHRRERAGGAVVTKLWETRGSPADNGGNAEATDHAFRLAPPKNGTVFRVIEYPPGRQRLAALERERASADDGSGHSAAFDRGSPR